MYDIYAIVEQAIDYAFMERKFTLNFYEYLKSSNITGLEISEFNKSSTASELALLIVDLDEYIKGGNDNDHKQLREGYGHVPKPEARKIRNYLNGILQDASRYAKKRKRGRPRIENK
jgi:hypothetical protein